jgi:hypothetical protein
VRALTVLVATAGLLLGISAARSEEIAPAPQGAERPVEAGDALARAILREAYWRGWWGGEERARKLVLGATLVVVVGPPGPWRSYCLPELQAVASVGVIGRDLVADIYFHGSDFGGCRAGLAGNTTTVLKLPSDISDVDIPAQHVAESIAGIRTSPSLRKNGMSRVWVSIDHTYDVNVAYALVGAKSTSPVLVFLDEHGKPAQVDELAGMAGRPGDARFATAMLKKHGVAVTIRIPER